jgi:predicted phage terminase large subunit-like protein
MSSITYRPQEGAQEIAMNCPASIVVYGGAAGSGKTHLMLLRPLLQIHDPKFNAIFFRRTGPQLTGAGSVWDEAKELYLEFGARVRENDREIIFPSGAKIKFSHMEHEKNKLDHQGKQYTHVYFDEGTHFTQGQITYLMSRLRSAAEANSSMFISCNPDPDSFIAQLIDWWLDDEGFPDKNKSGVIKYYGSINNEIFFTDTEEEMAELYPQVCWVWNPLTEERVYVSPKTITFIGGTIFDNPALIAANPQYLAELNALPQVEKDRLLHGNWYARPEGSSHFQRKWLGVVDKVPKGAIFCRAWDKAATEPSEVNAHPDYTASVKMAKDRDGFFYLIGDYHEDNYDKRDSKQTKVTGRFRERSGIRDVIIKNQAAHDGVECTVVFSQDPGSAGITEFTESAKKLIVEGFRVKKDPQPTQNGKLTRYLPFSSAAENGLVFIVKSSFSTATLEALFKENEAFDGTRSSDHRKDDWADSMASAFNFLCTTRTVRLVRRNQTRTSTMASEVLATEGVKISDLEELDKNLNNII